METPKEWGLVGGRLVRDFVFADFVEAMAFVNKVAERAEAAQHHPDVQIHWNKVRLELWTHTAGGVTEKDVALATTIDAILPA